MVVVADLGKKKVKKYPNRTIIMTSLLLSLCEGFNTGRVKKK
jgi:hypothetical protein